MEDRRTAMDTQRDMNVRRDVDRFEDNAWGFGTLLAVIAACFVVLGVLIYMFGEDQSTQTATNPPARPGPTMNAPAPATPGGPATTGQGAK